jgi:hypothetical protein
VSSASTIKITLTRRSTRRRYSASRQICVQAAKSLINNDIEPFEAPSNYWLTSYSLFTACVVLLREAAHAAHPQAIELCDLVKSGIDRLRYAISVRTACAYRCYSVVIQEAAVQTTADYLEKLLGMAIVPDVSTPLTYFSGGQDPD